MNNIYIVYTNDTTDAYTIEDELLKDELTAIRNEDGIKYASCNGETIKDIHPLTFEQLQDGKTYRATATDGNTYKGTYTANYGGVFFCVYPAFLADGKTENKLISFMEA